MQLGLDIDGAKLLNSLQNYTIDIDDKISLEVTSFLK